jgi:hypothetical protein
MLLSGAQSWIPTVQLFVKQPLYTVLDKNYHKINHKRIKQEHGKQPPQGNQGHNYSCVYSYKVLFSIQDFSIIIFPAKIQVPTSLSCTHAHNHSLHRPIAHASHFLGCMYPAVIKIFNTLPCILTSLMKQTTHCKLA